MALFIGNFLAITLIPTIIFLISSTATSKRHRDEKCIELMEEYCYKTGDELTAKNCAQQLVYHWIEDADHLIDPIIIPYHIHIIKNIRCGDIHLKKTYCKVSYIPEVLHEAYGEKETPEVYNEEKCLNDLDKFGDNKEDVFDYALRKTSVYKEDEISGSKSYSVQYMEYISELTYVKDGTFEPETYCSYYSVDT